MSNAEAKTIKDASERRGVPVARYIRECALAVARGRVIPAEWLQEATDDLIEAQSKIEGVKGYMPRGWESDLIARMDDIVHLQQHSLSGHHPDEDA
tara:strand:- start:85 stop:372 length:288 start_codon:yes stop_codon:yes gene_type:complete